MVHTSASRPNASSFSVSQDSKSKSLLLSVAISSELARLLIKWEWGCGWVCWSSIAAGCCAQNEKNVLLKAAGFPAYQNAYKNTIKPQDAKPVQPAACNLQPAACCVG